MSQKPMHFVTGIFLMLITQSGLACQQNDNWPDLSRWVCEVNEEMKLRDYNASFVRSAELVTDLRHIRYLRTSILAGNDETCRRFSSDRVDAALIRILRHQALPDTFSPDRTQFAAAEIWNDSTYPYLMSCESQVLTSEGRHHFYTNIYYLKFGSVREGKHLVLRVGTSWNDAP